MGGCSSCGSKKVNGLPVGCKNNGWCSKGGCGSILDVHDWLTNVQYIDGVVRHTIVEVKFKGTRKEFYRNPYKLFLEIGDAVVVESAMQGYDVGYVSLTGELVKLQLKKSNMKEDNPSIKKIVRKATPEDLETYEKAKAAEYPTMMRSREIAIYLRLVMKISDVEYQGDNTKATFFYTAEGRVDFRELIKQYAREFKVKIEMRQIGLRQEAGRLGGIGSCGRELCCSTWLTDFNSVPTSAARYQNLFLNPLKLSGQCGRLKCCLNYELDTYLEAWQEFPNENTRIKTEKGIARIEKIDILKKIIWFKYVDALDFKMYPIELDKVWDIINNEGEATAIADLDEIMVEEEDLFLGYKDMVGEDRIDRFEKKGFKKTKKKPNRNPNPNRPNPNKPQQKRTPIKLTDSEPLPALVNETTEQHRPNNERPRTGGNNRPNNAPRPNNNRPQGTNQRDNRDNNRNLQQGGNNQRPQNQNRPPQAPRENRGNQNSSTNNNEPPKTEG